MAAKKRNPGAVLNRMLEYLEEGEYDSQIDTIWGELVARRRAVRDIQNRRNMRNLSKPGTRVRTTGTLLRPKYLLGYVGEVVTKPPEFTRSRDNTIYVKLDRVPPRSKFDQVVGVPAGCLEPE